MANQTLTSTKTNRRFKPRLSKKAQLIRMLSTKSGTDVATVSKQLGWQPHTTRAAITGLKKEGYEISSERPGNGGGRRYRIMAEVKPSPQTTDRAVVALEVSNAG